VAKNGLGKGLGALLSEAEDEVSESIDASSANFNKNKKVSGSDTFIDVDLLEPNPQQPRTEFNEETLKELAESIKEHGVIQPILVEDNGNGGFYIIAGERRTRAARLAGLREVPVRIQKYSTQKKLEVALIENIQREDLNAVEEAQAYKKLMELGNLNQDDVAKRVGKNRSTVANCLRLLKLPPDMLASLANGQISAGHARALLSVTSSSDQRILFGKIVGSSLSVRDAESEATIINSPATAQSKNTTLKQSETRDPDLVHIEQQFLEKLGTKVSIKGNFDKGQLQIDYFSKDDLNRLYDLILGK
jgi:ParB family chromosome partitioning protein